MVLVIGALTALALTRSPSAPVDDSIESSEGNTPELGAAPILADQGDPEKPTYPSSWKASNLDALRDSTEFSFLVPRTPAASAKNVTAVYAMPGGAVAMDFPPIREPMSYLRQNYIEVYAAPWSEASDPKTTYSENLAGAPNKSKALVEIDGVTALTVSPHSELDDEQANPAFIRFVVDGIEYQVSGGEDMSALEDIASSIIQQSGAAKE